MLRVRTWVAGMVVVSSLLAAGPASAQERPNGPTGGDFIEGGAFDQTGYLAAFVEFQTAPDVAQGSTLQLVVHQCKAGDLAEAVLLGRPDTLVSATVPASGVVTLDLAIPLDVKLGFNRIRVSCAATATPYLVKDVVINVVPPGTPSAVTVLGVYMIAPPTPAATSSGPLPHTGSEARGLIGAGLALLLVGAALAMGVRERLHQKAGA